MKIATYHLMANVGDMILHTLHNSGKYVDKIYIAYSPELWAYKNHGMKNNDDINILKRSPYYRKIEIIIGNWKKDEDERNAVLDVARKDGIDYLITQDVDEFYPDFNKTIVEGIKNNPRYDYYWCNSHILWKNGFVCVDSDNRNVNQKMEVAVNVNSDLEFFRCRRPRLNVGNVKSTTLNGLFYHAVYMRTPEQMWSKINSWGHAKELKQAQYWFVNIWSRWTPETERLHYSRTGPVFKAVEQDLPNNVKEIIDAIRRTVEESPEVSFPEQHSN